MRRTDSEDLDVTDTVPKSGPAYAVLATHLRERILSGELQPGQRLPGDAELTAEFGVGRSTIREALRSLASQNLIQTTRGVTGGSFVSAPTVGHISAHLETGVALMAAAETVTVDQLMEVRNLMEVPAAGIAAFRRTDEHIAQLRQTIFDPTDAQGPETFTKNQEFHLVLLRAAQNPLLELITAPVFRVLSGRFGRDHAPDGFWTCVDHDHRAILDVVADGDSMGAMDLMRKHLDHLGDSYRQMDTLR
ncbi:MULTISPECIES: FadR/GntR family transcriptional regulator [Nocardiaceae]|uniref:FadR/GntR family transcriptional regulator n=1 Tax=Nocardiaceae TaxID=85025 RepID=UPI00036EFDDB|nr:MULTISPECIES: FadR/GntR family transcriptional regulator [Rhodococcus]OZD10992.1 FadR family transcriptional regulator [Rhodococcus sp. 06-156-4C]OZD14406.1 FadR family transcriptional regulator [Rhodococcus sp. 06-156-4a]OZD24739.1 FadR family transcriptional regulator [Rhodococcus sp. 06-156-3C]OZD27714.1 FadR family transcriptional regulator [Rhodococcus sp. 06-156-3b]OZD39694.1 FadR family transcriptional regulator [Rhodococcus sp. 06-156-3]